MTQSHSAGDRRPPSLLRRLSIALGAFLDILGDARLAQRVEALRRGSAADASDTRSPAPVAPPPALPPAAPPPAPAPAAATAPPASALRSTGPESALQLLALLQREARLVDFVGESLGGYSDADVGAAARVVHEGCAKVLREHFEIVPVRSEAEGSRVTLPAGFDASAVRLTGQVVGQPPFTGQLVHRGWRVAEVRLPLLAQGHDARIVAPAEVEL